MKRPAQDGKNEVVPAAKPKPRRRRNLELKRVVKEAKDVARLPIDAVVRHLDPEEFAVLLDELGWNPAADVELLVEMTGEDHKDNIRLAARKMLRELIVENARMFGLLKMQVEKFQRELPDMEGKMSVERSHYLLSNEPQKTREYLSRVVKNRPILEVIDAPKKPSKQEITTDGEEPTTETIESSEAGTGTAPGTRGGGCAVARAGDNDAGTGRGREGEDRAGEGSERDDYVEERRGGPADRSDGAGGDATEADGGHQLPDPGSHSKSKDAEGREWISGNIYRKRPTERPRFGKPIGRKPPTATTLGGGICTGPPGPDGDGDRRRGDAVTEEEPESERAGDTA